jgi:DNA-binding transcriptional ArsR family regulator
MGEWFDNILLLSTRRDIYQCIVQSPGLHLRELSRRLHMPLNTITYHLHILQKRELIIEKTEGRYHRYYDIHNIGTQGKKQINLLREDIPRTIILYLMIHYWSTQADISKSLQKHPTTIEHHLKKLMDLRIIQQVKPINGKVYQETFPKIIECEIVGREKVIMLKDPQQIYDLLITYKHNIIEDTISEHLFEFLNYFQTAGQPKKVIAPKKWEQGWEDLIWEIFPHPYH